MIGVSVLYSDPSVHVKRKQSEGPKLQYHPGKVFIIIIIINIIIIMIVIIGIIGIIIILLLWLLLLVVVVLVLLLLFHVHWINLTFSGFRKLLRKKAGL